MKLALRVDQRTGLDPKRRHARARASTGLAPVLLGGGRWGQRLRSSVPSRARRAIEPARGEYEHAAPNCRDTCIAGIAVLLWLGEAGPGPSYLDPGSGGPENDFTNRNTTFLAWNLMHMARMIKDAGGIPAHGNQKSLWDAGCRFDFANPDYR